jgi:hypothetical protein
MPRQSLAVIMSARRCRVRIGCHRQLVLGPVGASGNGDSGGVDEGELLGHVSMMRQGVGTKLEALSSTRGVLRSSNQRALTLANGRCLGVGRGSSKSERSKLEVSRVTVLATTASGVLSRYDDAL